MKAASRLGKSPAQPNMKCHHNEWSQIQSMIFNVQNVSDHLGKRWASQAQRQPTKCPTYLA